MNTPHIVCPRPQEDWVCARLAHYLERHNGWTVSPIPRREAPWNIYLPYLEYARHPLPPSRLAACMTHREEGNREKVRLWEGAKRTMDVLVTGARKYLAELAGEGKSVLIPYPVELDLFTPGEGRVKGRIGVSGTVYRGGRKGEGEVARLAREGYDLVASGRGWPVPTTWHAWREMPSFYRSLNVFLCTSKVEGGPLPVLEALACGVPVVVPRGVGAMDDLPEGPGIYRYRTYEEMKAQLELALATEHSPERLRSYVEGFTPERWAHEWAIALSDEALPDWRGRAGVYMVAYRKQARECARRAIESIHRWMPGLPVALVSDEPLGPEDRFIRQPDLDVGARSVKTKMYDLSPAEWDYVLYLDADTELTAPIPFLFDALRDGWEVVITQNPGRYHVARYMQRPDNHEECRATYEEIGSAEILQLQGGVVAFRRDENTARFLRAWHMEWQRWGKRDQAALLRALYRYPVRAYVLGIEWNCSDRYDSPNGNAGIIHHQTMARSFEGIIWGRLDSQEAWELAGDQGLPDPAPQRGGVDDHGNDPGNP